MAVRNLGKIRYDFDRKRFVIAACEPHVSIKLKNTFPKIGEGASPPYKFPDTPENCSDLLWFTSRYPMHIPPELMKKLKKGNKEYIDFRNQIELLQLPSYSPTLAVVKNVVPRHYQLTGRDMHLLMRNLLIGDEIGLGKTLTAILSLLDPRTLPAIVVVQTHVANQWKAVIENFTDLKTCVINGTKMYDLPQADVYIIRYSVLSKWVNMLANSFFKSIIFDEIQEMRRRESKKYEAGKSIIKYMQYTEGLSATPIYNYGEEIFNVLDLLNPGCLGIRDQFLREWCYSNGSHYIVRDTEALGTYLRDQGLMLRRTRKEVGRELPPVNKIVHTVGYDQEEFDKVEDLAYALAVRSTEGSFTERGQAGRQLDLLLRQVTGIAKAKEVAMFVKILLENGIPVLLGGWHRAVYDIWLEELAEFKPVMYTGTENAKEKDEAKRAFIAGETLLMIMSIRSGAGLDGLQKVCSTVVVGELDWSPKVIEQFIGRVDRDGKIEEKESVSAFIMVSDEGSDPPMIDILGLKASQSQGILDPMLAIEEQFSDESRIKMLAQAYLNKKKSSQSN